MFNNTVNPLYYPQEPIPTSHDGLPWTDNGPSFAFFSMFVLYILTLCCETCIHALLLHCGIAKADEEMEVDEALGNFFECIGGLKRKDWLATEVSNANRLGIKTMGTGVFEEMRTTKG